MPKSLPQHILENLNTTVMLVDSNLILSAINPAGEMLFETGSRQATGQPLAHLLPHNQALLEAMYQTLVSGHPFTEHGLRLGVPVNRWITVDCTVTPVSHADGKSELILEINPID
ncbi:MAG: PAS domain-containing protein, partial [Pseudomonadota bacterium]